MSTLQKARPFIKWVGGKGQLIPQLEKALPPILNHESFTYIEPFVGGGAMLFFMLQRFSNIKRVIINDINNNLTVAYQVIRETPEELVRRTRNIENEYKSLHGENARKEFFLDMRDRFNKEPMDNIEKTSLLIFLNKTCFNGLYRENSKGEFNVPFGKYANPNICNEDVILADSELLNKCNVQILTGDFTQTYNYMDDEELSFLYFDPPYRPLSATSSFNSYVKEKFNDESHIQLANYCRMLSVRKNYLWMLSNADCSAMNPDDLFFETIYRGFNIQRVYASRFVNSVASKRGKLTELLIKNYETNEKQLYKAI